MNTGNSPAEILIGSRIPQKAFEIYFGRKEPDSAVAVCSVNPELLSAARVGHRIVIIDKSAKHGVENPEELVNEIKRTNGNAIVLEFSDWNGFAAFHPLIRTTLELRRAV